MEEKEDGISLGDIFHVLLIKKWLLLAVTLVITLVGVIFVQFFYNPRKIEYHATFEIRFPKVEEGRYPDGTEYLYKEFISLENLKKAQETNEKFSTIDVEAMKGSNAISIQENEILVNNEPVKTGIFTIYVMKNYFDSSEQARDYMLALISIPAQMVVEKSKLIDYDRYLKQFNLVEDYASQMDILINQKNLIISNYESLINNYSTVHSITLEEGTTKTISEAQSEIESYFTRYDLEAMKNEIEQNGYVQPDSEFLITVQNRKAQLEREFIENNMKLKNLNDQIKELGGSTGQTVILQDLISTMSSLTARNAEIEYTIENVYEKYLNAMNEPGYAEKLAAFEVRLKTHYEKLQEFTDVYAAFNNEIYETNTKILVSAGSIIVQDGGVSLYLSLAVFLVIGLLLGCCLNLCLDMPKYLKEKKNKDQVEEPKEEIPTLTEE
ncbi:MAG: hypothetical protein K2N64_04680 [Anaeroplasmataceae bacterium]|nr:hypothetical protein [Anaeroplasmataceae bacterium]